VPYSVLEVVLKQTDRSRQHNTRDQGMKMNKVKTQSQEGMEEANTMEEEVIVLGEAAVEARQEASVEIPEATIMLVEEEDIAQVEVTIPDLLRAVKVFHLDPPAIMMHHQMMWLLLTEESGSGL